MPEISHLCSASPPVSLSSLGLIRAAAGVHAAPTGYSRISISRDQQARTYAIERTCNDANLPTCIMQVCIVASRTVRSCNRLSIVLLM